MLNLIQHQGDDDGTARADEAERSQLIVCTQTPLHTSTRAWHRAWLIPKFNEYDRYPTTARPELVEGSSFRSKGLKKEEQPFDKLRVSGDGWAQRVLLQDGPQKGRKTFFSCTIGINLLYGWDDNSNHRPSNHPRFLRSLSRSGAAVATSPDLRADHSQRPHGANTLFV
jgi:hypothetical protein